MASKLELSKEELATISAWGAVCCTSQYASEEDKALHGKLRVFLDKSPKKAYVTVQVEGGLPAESTKFDLADKNFASDLRQLADSFNENPVLNTLKGLCKTNAEAGRYSGEIYVQKDKEAEVLDALKELGLEMTNVNRKAEVQGNKLVQIGFSWGSEDK